MGRALLVEDDLQVRWFFSELLTELGFEVTTAINLEDALAAVDNSPFDLVLTDLVYPNSRTDMKKEKNGLILGRHMQENHPHILTILMTGGSLEAWLRPGERDIFHQAFTRPIPSSEFKKMIVGFSPRRGFPPLDALLGDSSLC